MAGRVELKQLLGILDCNWWVEIKQLLGINRVELKIYFSFALQSLSLFTFVVVVFIIIIIIIHAVFFCILLS